MTGSKYKTAEAFRAALEARARKEATANRRSIQRVLNVYVMQRFLARAIDELGDRVTVKGGMALELRLERARATKDVNLRLDGRRDHHVDRLRDAVERSGASDWLTFTLTKNATDPDIDGDGVVYEGVRLRAQAFLAAKKYGGSFGVDVAIGDPMTGPREYRRGPNLLDIVGALPVDIPLYPVATHLAEKVHAYTLPRERINGRLKDLLDIALIASELAIDGATLRAALEATFDFRRSHPLPPSVPPPPAPWAGRYLKDRDEQGLLWASIDEVHVEAARFLDPILAGGGGTWEPAARAWTAAGR